MKMSCMVELELMYLFVAFVLMVFGYFLDSAFIVEEIHVNSMSKQFAIKAVNLMT